ncbi:MAG TPA: hypothetical protein VHD60_03115 [Candidatus Saccharimonadales bacterium]|nr:hypothetical protein [Candidatus Saccharimonadales bacterium]
MTTFPNPFKPGAGHQPPYLAGREEETHEFEELLAQEVVLHNLILSGLRGIGKTVLLESFKPLAQQKGWLWAGTDCSEAYSNDENTMVIRLLTDIALVTSSIKVGSRPSVGFQPPNITRDTYLNFDFLINYYTSVPGLPADKLKALLSFVWACLQPAGVKGVVFAYDEAQTLSDHAKDKQYPLSLLLDVFQFLQKNNIPYMLVLTGLPTLLVKLVETRTYSERLFRVRILDRLTDKESRDAILIPIKKSHHPLGFSDVGVNLIVDQSGGYPYFIQFICREAYDILEQQLTRGEIPSLPMDAILQKLDNDFFAGRWAQATDRERDLLSVMAALGTSEFSVSQIVEQAKKQPGLKPFSSSQVSQMLNRLIEISLIYKNRRGSYSFAVPLLDRYITRNNEAKPL